MSSQENNPRPLVPSNVDLRDFPYTPIQRARLFGSSFHATATDSEWRRGVILWLKSWDQVPSGTLPTDERHQCNLAELHDLKVWRKLKAVALHNWFEATDGLLYHPIVAEVVLEAWIEKLGLRLSGGAGNAKRWGYTFDRTAIESEIATASSLLFALNPESKALRRKRGGSHPHPDGSPDGNPNGSPDRIAREVKRSKVNIENRDVEVTPPPEASDQAGEARIAGGKTATATPQPKSGQDWDDPAYVAATAKTVDVARLIGESASAFRDRVFCAVRELRNAAR